MVPRIARAVTLLAMLVVLVALAACRSASVSSAPAPPASEQPGRTAKATSAPVREKPAAPVDVDRERIAREATWAPGQLQAHFEKHGREGPWTSEAAYDASARETIQIGALFTYLDRASNAERLGAYHKPSNRFVGISRDGRRITTQFKPDRGEAYVRSLARSTYR